MDEFTADVISEGTHEGLAAARARGRVGGRPLVMTPTKLAVAREIVDAGEHTMAEIARTLGVGRATLYRHLAPELGRHGMVDVVFRNVDEATLRRLLEILGDTSYVIEDEEPEWMPELAERVLRMATPRAVALSRALVEHGGEVDIDAARRAVREVHPGQAMASLNAAWRKLGRYTPARRGERRPPGPSRRPVESLKERTAAGTAARASGYRLDPTAVAAFREALGILGR